MNNGLSVQPTYKLYPETRPLYPSIYDDEFDGPSLDPKWHINSAVTYAYLYPQTFFQQSQLITSGSSYGDANSYQFRLAQSAPQYPWAVSAQINFWQATNTTTPIAGLFLQAQSNASYHYGLNIHSANTNLFFDVYKYNPNLSFNSTLSEQSLGGILSTGALVRTAMPQESLVEMKFQIRNDGTTIYFDIGQLNGGYQNWASEAISTFFASPVTAFGLVLCPCSSVEWFRFRNTSTVNVV
jgi:hypothetical protein